MKYASAKAKGKRLEYEIAKRYVDYGIDKNATRMPLSGADTYLKGDVRHAHNTAIPLKLIDECKNQENINWFQWWKQACEQVNIGETPVLHFKKNNSETLTLLKTDDFFTLLGELVRLNDQTDIRGEIVVDDSIDKKTAIYNIDYAIENLKKAKKFLNKDD